MFAGRCLAFGFNPDAFAIRPIGKLIQDDVRSLKATFFATPLVDDPVQITFNRGGRGVDIIAIQAKTGFQTQ